MRYPRRFDMLLHAFFPDRCAFCGRVIRFDEEICDECRENLNRQVRPICTGCGRSKPHCQCKTDGRRSWDGVVAPFVYDDDITGNAIRRLKRSYNQKNSDTLAKEMADIVAETFPNVTFDCVMPVPMTRKDEYERGYSQSRWLAETIADELGVHFEDRLKKIMQTPAQKTLSAAKRRVNLRGAIDMDERFDAPDKTILVVDDTITTGATLEECARILKIYGARAVYAAAVCIVYKKGNETNAGSETGN